MEMCCLWHPTQKHAGFLTDGRWRRDTILQHARRLACAC